MENGIAHMENKICTQNCKGKGSKKQNYLTELWVLNSFNWLSFEIMKKIINL